MFPVSGHRAYPYLHSALYYKFRMTFRPRPFEPLFRNPHLETIAAHFWPRPDPDARIPARAPFHSHRARR